jgi:hypothetical protein
MPDAANVADKGRSLLALAATVAPRVHIEGIQLARCQAMRTVPIAETALRIEYGFTGETKADREQNRIAVTAFFTVRGQLPDSSEPSPLKLDVEFHLDYKITSFDGISDDTLDAFGKINGVFNAWSYCREFVQSTTTRMGLPALTLPLLTGNAIQQMYEMKAAEEAEAKTKPNAGAGPTPPP